MNLDNILQGCRQQQQSSQELLVHTFAPKLLAICMRYCRDKDLAKDALQETFINIFKYINTYNGESEFMAWARRIAVNNCLKINQKFFKLNIVEDKEINFNDHSYIPDVYSKLSVEDIMELCNQLSESQFIVFNMFAIEGFSHKEICTTLNITESSSRSLLTRARMKLIDLVNNMEDNHNNTIFNARIALL